MLPEQRGILTGFFSRFRSRNGNDAPKARRRKAHYGRRSMVEQLEDRRLLTGNLYVDFGDNPAFGNVTMSPGAWSTLGLAPPANQPSWVFGPQFVGPNVAITYTPFANTVATAIAQGFTFDPGPNPAEDPFEFETGPELPINTVAALENSVIEILQREFAPFNINVVPTAVANIGAARNLLAGNNRLVDPYQTLANPVPNPDNRYNLTTANPAGFVPPGFDATLLNTLAGYPYAAVGSPIQTQDVFILIGGYTRPLPNLPSDVGTQTGNFGFSEPHQFSTFADAADPIFGVPGMPGPNAFPIPITYSDASVAVDTTTIFNNQLFGSDAKFRTNVAIAAVAAQMAMITYGGAYIDANNVTQQLQQSASGLPSVGNPFFDADIQLLSGSDAMRQGPKEFPSPIPNGQDVPVFSRFPMMIGGANQDPTLTQNAFDYMSGSPDLGVATFFANPITGIISPIQYVTGTGAFDRITITASSTPGFADVKVYPYRDNTFADSSFLTVQTASATYDLANPFTYQIDLTTPGTTVLVELGQSDDRVEIDPALGAINFEVYGGGGVDSMSVVDDGSDDVAVTPSNVNAFAFSGVERFDTRIDLTNGIGAGMVIHAQEFDNPGFLGIAAPPSTIHLQDFKSLSYQMLQFLGATFTMTSRVGSALDDPQNLNGEDMTIDGTAGPTVLSPIIGVVPVEFVGIPNVTINCVVGATDDSVFVDATDANGGYPDLLANLTVNLGPGNDTLSVAADTFILPGGGSVVYNGGAGTDTVIAAGDVDWTLTDTAVMAASNGVSKGSIQIVNKSVEVADLTGGNSANTFTVINWAGGGVLTGLAGDDTFIIGDTTHKITKDFSVDAGDGNDTISIVNYSGAGSFVGGNGNDTFNVGTATIKVSGNFSMDGGADNDTFNINSWAGNGNITAGSGDDILNIKSWTGSGTLDGGDGNDIFTFLLWSGTGANSVLGGNGNDQFFIGTPGNPITASFPLDAGDGQDTINITAWIGSGNVDAGPADDTINIVNWSGGGNVTGNDGNDQINITSWTGNGNLNGGTGDDNFQITTRTGNGNLGGDDGNDTFVINQWTGNGNFSGGTGNDNFQVTTWKGTGNYTGDDGNDTFVVASRLGNGNFGGGNGNDIITILTWVAAGTPAGVITGDAGNDTINIGDTTVANTVAANFTASGGDGNDVFNIRGWSGTGSLSGDANDDVFNIGTAGKAITANFSMNGGDGINTFNIVNWTGSGDMNGGAGVDNIQVTSHVGNGNINAGDGNDSISINSWTGNGNVSAGNGDDIITLLAWTETGGFVANVNGDAGNDTFNVGTTSNALAAKFAASGGDGNDIFNINGWTGGGSLGGDAGNDTFNIGSVGHAITSNFSIDGGDDADTFRLNAWSGTGDLDGGDGNDSFFIGVGGDIDTITAHHSLVAGDGTDTVTLDDSAGSEAVNYDVTPTLVQDDPSTPRPFGGLDIDGTLETLNLTGTTGNNTFFVTPSFDTTFRIFGNIQPTADSLQVDFTDTTGAKLTKNGTSGSWSFTSGQQTVFFNGIEQLQLGGAAAQAVSFLAAGADAGKGSKPLVKVYDSASNNVLFSFYAYETTFTGGVRVAVGDVTGDGVPDIITAPGAGRVGEVRVFDGAALLSKASPSGIHLVSNALTPVASGGALVSKVTPEGTAYKSGLYLAVGNLDSDPQQSEIVTSSATGLGKVRVYTESAGTLIQERLIVPYLASEKVTTGAVVAVGDLNNDGLNEIVTAPGAGVVSTVKIFNGQTGALQRKFQGFESTFKNGVSLAVADVNADGAAEIMLGAGSGGNSRVRVFNQIGTLQKEFQAYTTGNIKVPLHIVAKKVGDVTLLFVAQSNDGRSREIRGFDALTGRLVDSFLETEPTFNGGIYLG